MESTVYELETFKVKLAVAEPADTRCPSSLDAEAILRSIYASLDCDQEHFVVLLLNNKNFIRGYKVISSGTQTTNLVHPSMVFRAAVLYGASAIIISHNHPSGNPSPSPEDIDITGRLVRCGELFGIRVLDHLILGDGSCYSFNDRGEMSGHVKPPCAVRPRVERRGRPRKFRDQPVRPERQGKTNECADAIAESRNARQVLEQILESGDAALVDCTLELLDRAVRRLRVLWEPTKRETKPFTAKNLPKKKTGTKTAA